MKIGCIEHAQSLEIDEVSGNNESATCSQTINDTAGSRITTVDPRSRDIR